MEDSRPFVVVGLGNPGPRYHRTRHNIGFVLVERLVEEWGARRLADHETYSSWEASVDGRTVFLLQPRTYMNRSGAALQRFPALDKAGPDGHLVVLDDISLPFGSIRFRRGGGDGGHRGLRSILQVLDSQDVPRLRLGVGDREPESETDLAEWVLEPFSSKEEAEFDSWLDPAAQGVRAFLREGIDTAMNRFNR